MFSHINLTHLKYFYDAVHTGSISSAARENLVSQSAISQGIIKLEQALQVTLTTHQRQSFKLTEEGHILFEEAKKIFQAVDGLKERLFNLKGEVSGEVKFACTNALAQYFLPPIYLKAKEQLPLVRLKFHRGNLQFIHDALRQDKVSFALAIDAPAFYGYEKEIIFKGKFSLYKARNVVESEVIFIDHFENREVIELLNSYKKNYRNELTGLESLSGWSLVATFVQMGCGKGFLPDFFFNENPTVEEIKLNLPPIEYSICAIWPKGSILSIAAKAFLKTLMTPLTQNAKHFA